MGPTRNSEGELYLPLQRVRQERVPFALLHARLEQQHLDARHKQCCCCSCFSEEYAERDFSNASVALCSQRFVSPAHRSQSHNKSHSWSTIYFVGVDHTLEVHIIRRLQVFRYFFVGYNDYHITYCCTGTQMSFAKRGWYPVFSILRCLSRFLLGETQRFLPMITSPVVVVIMFARAVWPTPPFPVQPKSLLCSLSVCGRLRFYGGSVHHIPDLPKTRRGVMFKECTICRRFSIEDLIGEYRSEIWLLRVSLSRVLNEQARAAAAAEKIRVFEVPQQMPSTNEEPRQWQWIFRALWSAAPKLALHAQDGGVAAEATTFDLKTLCHLKLLVPDTILFERGEPCKWVGCSPDGIVVRKPFLRASSPSGGFGVESVSSIAASRAGEVEFGSGHPTLTTRVATKRRTRILDDFEVAERLDVVIAAFLSFAASGPSLLSKPSSLGPDVTSDVPICIARYNDGTTELLSGKSLKTLCAFYNWRASLCALQAFVRPSHETSTTRRIGTYTRRDERHKTNLQYHHYLRPLTTAKDNHLAPGSKYAEDQTLEHKPSTPISTTNDTPEVQSAGIPPAVAANDASSTSSSMQVSTMALDQATKDVAFVTDMSYAWPTEPSRTTPRRGHGNAAVANNDGSQDRKDIRSPEDQEKEMNGGGSFAATPSVLVISRKSGEPRCHSPPWPKSRVRVSRLEAEFVVDHAGRPWFTNALKV